MGILSAFRLVEASSTLAPTGKSKAGVLSPFSTQTASKIVWSDIFGTKATWITRAEAMTLPPVVKGRAIIVGQIAPVPLVALDENGVLAEQPEWMQHTDGAYSPYHRMVWTLDDLIFHGMSVWAIERTDGPTSPITSAVRLPREWWEINTDGLLSVTLGDGQPFVPAAHEVIVFNSASEGLLEFGTRSIRGAVLLEDAWVKRSRNPIPLVELHETVDGGLEPDEVESLITDFMAAREDVNGMVTFTPHSITMIVHGEQAPALAIEGRNFAKVDMANFFNLPASALDGSLSTASLTYSTQEGARNEIADYGLSYWSDPIAARLSQDDVVDPGVRTRFDWAQVRTVTPNPTGTPTKD